MIQLYYKYKNERDRSSCMDFLKHSGFWNDIDIDISRSVSRRLTISMEADGADDFSIRAKYKGFKFHEVD